MTDRPVVTRRSILSAAAVAIPIALVIPAAIAPPAEAARRTMASRTIFLDNVHTGERLKAVYWADGRYFPDQLRRISWLLRDHHRDEACPIDPELIDLLARLHQRLSTSEPFQILSGYRSAATNAMLAAQTDGVAQNSLHMQGMAVDICVPGRNLVKVRRAAVAMQAGGVGFYPRSGFVHVDVGRVRYW
jgi:uncharacterized protein YcbK (DUF882 family)